MRKFAIVFYRSYAQPGVPPGDVVFILKMAHHDFFERSGNDLLTTVKITLSEALLGFDRILVTHLDGRGVRVTSPKGKVIQPGQSIVLRGEGMPTYKTPDVKGDLYVVFDIEMPTSDWLRTVDLTVRINNHDTLRTRGLIHLMHHSN